MFGSVLSADWYICGFRGELRIAEVKSRIADMDEFVSFLQELGFDLESKVRQE